MNCYFISICFCLRLLLDSVVYVTAHGGMVEPPMRSVAWRYGYEAPVNYDWMALYCGGFGKFQQNGGKCGLCGDPFDGPFENDKGGAYDTGVIVRNYPIDIREIGVKIEITAHHKGHFEFKLCPNNDKALTQECLDRNLLIIKEAREQGDPFRYFPPESPNLHELHVLLPVDVRCDRCVLQWKYTTGNNVGKANNGQSCLGCGMQETFINCADIAIGGTIEKIDIVKDDTVPPLPDVVIGAQPDTVQIIESLSTNSFKDLMRALRIPSNSRTDIASEIATHALRELNPRNRFNDPQPKVDQIGTQVESNVIQQDPHTFQDFGTRFDRNQQPVNQSDNILSSPDFLPSNPQLVQRSLRNPDTTLLSLASVENTNVRNMDAANAWNSGSAWNSGNAWNIQLRQNMIGSFRSEFGGKSEMPGNNAFLPNIDSLSRQNIQLPSDRGVENNFGIPNLNIDNAVSLLSDTFPNRNDWRRGDRVSFPSESIRQAQNLEVPSFSPRALQEYVPNVQNMIGQRIDLPNSIGVRQDLRNHVRKNWLQDNHAQVQIPRPAFAPEISSRLPTRIVVDSMAIAQNLIRKWPQLRGRVFLSKDAHLRNVYAHMEHKYALRQRWL